MRYRELPPPPSLRAFVRTFWILEDDRGPGDVERILPDGCVEVVIHYRSPFVRCLDDGRQEPQSRSVVAGQLRTATRMRSSGPTGIIAARMHPWAAGLLLADSARTLTAQIAPLADVWGADARRLEERVALARGDEERLALLVEHLRTVLLPPDDLGDGVRHALGLITATRGAIRVGEIAERLAWSRRRLERGFDAAVGLPPKALCRIERFQHVVRAAGNPTRPRLAPLALATGYADQAHLAREFRELAGLSITEYLAEQHSLSDAFTAGARG